MADPLSLVVFQMLMGLTEAHATGSLPHQTAHKVDTKNITRSLGDTAENILRCYHPTGRYQDVSVVQVPWSGAQKFNATRSVLIRIIWRGGYVGLPYETLVGVMSRDGALKTIVASDSAIMPPNPKCELGNWVAVNQPAKLN